MDFRHDNQRSKMDGTILYNGRENKNPLECSKLDSDQNRKKKPWMQTQAK